MYYCYFDRSSYFRHDHVLFPNPAPIYLQIWPRAHFGWYRAIPPLLEVKLQLSQALTIAKLNRQVMELRQQLKTSSSRSNERESTWLERDPVLISSSMLCFFFNLAHRIKAIPLSVVWQTTR